MNKYLPLLFILVLILSHANAQKITINGTIKDYDTGETLIGVNVFDTGLQKGTSSNNYGFYSYTTAKGKVELVFSYVGYDPFAFSTIVEKDTTLNIRLSPSHLTEVVVEGSREEVIQERTQMGAVNVPLRQIKSMPALFGEVDVLKVLQLLPGVQSGTEGASGMYVRGGGPDQNLILLDGVPVYNASHLFGFFSIFNADAINNVELIKGGFPARYGGRLSSVVEINMKEGNMKEFHGEGTLGLLASKLTLEGPIVKDKTSFLLSGRRSYLDLLARPFMNEEQDAGYYFYDLNAKVNHIINENNRIYLSFYGGDDKGFTSSDRTFLDHKKEDTRHRQQTRVNWGNMISALRWNHIFNQKLFANFSASYTRYRFGLFNMDDLTYIEEGKTKNNYYHADYRSSIRDYALKADFDFIPNSSHYIRFGANHINHQFAPGVYTAVDKEEVIDYLGAPVTDSREYAFYVEDDVQLGQQLKLNLGMHYSGFLTEAQHYNSLQPRVSIRYLLDGNTSLKASYVTMAQFIHMLTNAGLGLPTDLWVPVTDDIGPQHSWQTSLGYYKSLPGGLELSLEAYYKEMTGLLEYKDGASYLNIHENWETKVEVGEGRSYGVEMLVQKKIGRTTGWIGYTLSKTERRFDAFNDSEWFPFRYDRTHDVSTTLSHLLTDRIQLSATWVYGTGNAISMPSQKYQSQQGYSYYNSPPGFLENYPSRNNYRMRDYHRLDLGASFIKKKRWGERTWNVSVYNAYNRLNPFYMEIQNHIQTNQRTLVQYTLFPALPSVSYGFKF